MWNVTLGYIESGMIFHWELVFEYDWDEEDGSCGCPLAPEDAIDWEPDELCFEERCEHPPYPDEYYQWIDRGAGHWAPRNVIHVVHVRRSEDGQEFEFEHKSLDLMSTRVTESAVLGDFTNVELEAIIDECESLGVPGQRDDTKADEGKEKCPGTESDNKDVTENGSHAGTNSDDSQSDDDDDNDHDDDEFDENYQTWVWKAMEDVLAKRADLVDNWAEILENVAKLEQDQ